MFLRALELSPRPTRLSVATAGPPAVVRDYCLPPSSTFVTWRACISGRTTRVVEWPDAAGWTFQFEQSSRTRYGSRFARLTTGRRGREGGGLLRWLLTWVTSKSRNRFRAIDIELIWAPWFGPDKHLIPFRRVDRINHDISDNYILNIEPRNE